MQCLSRRIAFTIAALASSVCMAVPASAQGLGRIELHSFPSVTVSAKQFLTGDQYGKPVSITGELRLPRTTDPAKVGVVILMHGSGGLNPAHDKWAHELNEIGVAALILDSFTGRGIVNTNTDQSQLDSISMTHDAYAALSKLATHPRIDPSRIAVMGFSKGAVPAVYSSNLRFRKLYGPSTAEFAAHIGLYTPCNIAYNQDFQTTNRPIRLHHGLADDYVSIDPCRSYAKRLKEVGADVTLTEYADAHHAYDALHIAPLVPVPTSQTTRKCSIKEGEQGTLLNAATGQPYSLEDPCVARGAHIGYNAAARQATVRAVQEFLTTTFKLKTN